MKPMPKYVYKLFNACIGFALGDAYGLPFVNFKKYDAHLYNQKQEMVKRQNDDLPEGSWGICTSQLLGSMEQLTHLRDNIDVCAKEPPSELLASYKLDSSDGIFPRLLPIAFLLKDQAVTSKYNWVKQITSAANQDYNHYLCGFIYLELINGLLHDLSVEEAYKQSIDSVRTISKLRLIDERIQNMVSSKIGDWTISDIKGNGNVLDTLQSVIWVMFQSSDYRSAVHLATCIGGKTDLLAALVGGGGCFVF